MKLDLLYKWVRATELLSLLYITDTHSAISAEVTWFSQLNRCCRSKLNILLLHVCTLVFDMFLQFQMFTSLKIHALVVLIQSSNKSSFRIQRCCRQQSPSISAHYDEVLRARLLIGWWRFALTLVGNLSDAACHTLTPFLWHHGISAVLIFF